MWSHCWSITSTPAGRSPSVKKLLIILLFMSLFHTIVYGIERRREQFVTNFGYVAIPIPFSIPGVGSGLGVAGNINNIPMFGEETTTDLYALTIPIGDVKGSIIGVTDIPLWPKPLIFLNTIRPGSSSEGSTSTCAPRGSAVRI